MADRTRVPDTQRQAGGSPKTSVPASASATGEFTSMDADALRAFMRDLRLRTQYGSLGGSSYARMSQGLQRAGLSNSEAARAHSFEGSEVEAKATPAATELSFEEETDWAVEKSDVPQAAAEIARIVESDEGGNDPLEASRAADHVNSTTIFNHLTKGPDERTDDLFLTLSNTPYHPRKNEYGKPPDTLLDAVERFYERRSRRSFDRSNAIQVRKLLDRHGYKRVRQVVLRPAASSTPAPRSVQETVLRRAIAALAKAPRESFEKGDIYANLIAKDPLADKLTEIERRALADEISRLRFYDEAERYGPTAALRERYNFEWHQAGRDIRNQRQYDLWIGAATFGAVTVVGVLGGYLGGAVAIAALEALGISANGAIAGLVVQGAATVADAAAGSVATLVLGDEALDEATVKEAVEDNLLMAAAIEILRLSARRLALRSVNLTDPDVGFVIKKGDLVSARKSRNGTTVAVDADSNTATIIQMDRTDLLTDAQKKNLPFVKPEVDTAPSRAASSKAGRSSTGVPEGTPEAHVIAAENARKADLARPSEPLAERPELRAAPVEGGSTGPQKKIGGAETAAEPSATTADDLAPVTGPGPASPTAPGSFSPADQRAAAKAFQGTFAQDEALSALWARAAAGAKDYPTARGRFWELVNADGGTDADAVRKMLDIAGYDLQGGDRAPLLRMLTGDVRAGRERADRVLTIDHKADQHGNQDLTLDPANLQFLQGRDNSSRSNRFTPTDEPKVGWKEFREQQNERRPSVERRQSEAKLREWIRKRKGNSP